MCSEPDSRDTRDCVDISLKGGSKEYTLIDTAGIRRKNREHEVVDKFAAIRAENAIEKADICVLMLDAEQGITAQEKRIAQILEAEGKGCVILLNKWDLVKGFRMEHCLKGIQAEASFLSHCPTYFISDEKSRNFTHVFPAIDKVAENMGKSHNRTAQQVLRKSHSAVSSTDDTRKAGFEFSTWPR